MRITNITLEYDANDDWERDMVEMDRAGYSPASVATAFGRTTVEYVLLNEPALHGYTGMKITTLWEGDHVRELGGLE